jgi:hypothetical protein
MTSDHEVRALIECAGWHHEHPVTGKMALINPDGPAFAATLEALLAERDTAVNLATVSAYESGVSDGADAEREQAVKWLQKMQDDHIKINLIRAATYANAAAAFARNKHRRKDDGQ